MIIDLDAWTLEGLIWTAICMGGGFVLALACYYLDDWR